MSPIATPGAARGPKPGILLLTVGAAAVAAGVFLPRMLPAVEAPQPRAESATASAGDKQPLTYQPPAWPDAPNSRDILTRLGLGTALVLGLCVGTLWAARRWLGGPVTAANGTSHLQLLETLSFGNRCCLHLVRAANQSVLVGVDAGGLKALLPVGDSFEAALAGFQGREPPNDAQGEPSEGEPSRVDSAGD